MTVKNIKDSANQSKYKKKAEKTADLNESHTLQEMAIGYYSMGVHKNIAHNAFDEKPKKILETVSYDWNDDSRGFQLVKVIRGGVDYKAFESVAVNTPLKDKDWAVILDTTLRTLIRYKKDNKTFAPKQTEKIIEIQQLMQYGEAVFGDMDSFHLWLSMRNVAMGGVCPKELLDTSVGLTIVKDALGRIEHGILA